jgi:hypothetical protein
VGWTLTTSDRQTFSIYGSAIIGRSANAQIMLNDHLASRQHAEFRAQGNTLIVTDLNSVNGTYVNGVRIATSRTLRPGDQITIGNTALWIRWVPDQAIAPPAPVPGPIVQQPFVPAQSAKFMYCPNCYAQVAEGAEICSNCGFGLTRGRGRALEREADDKEWLITLLLCIFVGSLGAHRFYTGHFGIGVVQLLTLGLCGIWTIIDLISILTGNYRDAWGRPLLKQ